MLKYLVAGLLLSLSISEAIAEIRYISDELRIPFRSDPGSSKRIMKMIKSGTPVEVINIDNKNGYAKIRTADGRIGFVLVRHLIKEPTAREQLQKMQERVQKQEAELDYNRHKLNQLQNDYSTLLNQHQKVSAVNAMLKQELNGIKQAPANTIK